MKLNPGLDGKRKSTGVSVGIAGAGLMGRLLALRLADAGWSVTLLDSDDTNGVQSCAYVGAGMLAPFSELETAEPVIAQLGLDSLPLWRNLLERLEADGSERVFMRENGTLVIAHPLDMAELKRFSQQVRQGIERWKEFFPNAAAQADSALNIRWNLSATDIENLEPELPGQFSQGVFIPVEGQIDNRQLLLALKKTLLAHPRVVWETGVSVKSIGNGEIEDASRIRRFERTVDCRGLGARPQFPAIRGVRGELLRVHAPDVRLYRPIRLMHPRHPLYIVPREESRFLIGATSIESEDQRPVTAQSALELLSAALTVHSGFAEAYIEEMNVQRRPALPHHRPLIRFSSGSLQINGLYRHGFLMAPKLASMAADMLTYGTRSIPAGYELLYETREFENRHVAAYQR